ncbi:MAG: Soluble calcium-activated nucleotidase 1, partial [Paramarteilia canceri]
TEFFDVILISDDDTKTKISADNFQSNLAKYSIILTTVPTKLALKAGGTSHVEAMKIIPSNQYKINSKEMKIPIKNLDRFMELSALAYFNGKLLTCDDRTGIIMEIDENAQKSDVWFSLLKYDPGFKCEWMTVKNGKLFVGSFGKNYVDTETGDIIHSRFTKVFMINKDKKTEILEWKENYDKIN